MTTTMKYAKLDLGTIEAVVNKLGGLDGIQRFLSGATEVVAAAQLFTFYSAVTVSAKRVAIVSMEWLEEAGVAWTDDCFKHNFIGLEAINHKGDELLVRRLARPANNKVILAALDDKYETDILQFGAFLNGKRRSTKGYVFYLRGKDGEFLSVYSHWDHNRTGWRVWAHPVTDTIEWDTGHLVVVSR